jgi:hypothetical protein
MNYSWQILNLSTKTQVNKDGVELQNAVIHIQWKRIGVDSDGNEATYLGQSTFTAENVSTDSFIAFDSLTEEIVVGWIEHDLGELQMDLIHNTIQKRINKNTMVKRSPPWASA